MQKLRLTEQQVCILYATGEQSITGPIQRQRLHSGWASLQYCWVTSVPQSKGNKARGCCHLLVKCSGPLTPTWYSS